MFNADELSRSSVANGGFGDPNLTPKPLRISKREHAGTSMEGTVNSSVYLGKSQTYRNLQAFAPSNGSSTWVNSMQLDLSSQDLTTPTSQWARRNAYLHVNKQRQAEPIDTNTAALTAISEDPIGSSRFNCPAASRGSCPTMGQLEKSSDASRAITAARPASTRAFTTGSYRTANPLSPVHETSSSPSAPSALRGGHRRAVTNAEAFYKELDALISLPHRVLRKQHSFRPSLMSRMVSGWTSKTHASRAVPWNKNDDLQISLGSPPATPSRAREDTYALRPSVSCTGSDTCSESDDHDALTTFPTPPTSRSTTAGSLNSPPSIRTGSLDSPPLVRSKRFRELCTPADPVLMGAELTLTPEYDQFSFDNGRSMWVSLDIKAATNSTSRLPDVWSQHTGLDVVVVIDNSLHTSPTALLASCETARFLASILNVMTDRLAIICTSTTDSNTAKSTVIRDLSSIKLHRIKTALDTIMSSVEKPKPNAWIDALDCAKELLLKSTLSHPDEEPLQDTFGHIFLLTPGADGLPLQSLAHEKLAFHVICPAHAPWTDQTSIHCNGWKLRSLSGSETQAVRTKKDLDATSVSNRLRSLVAQARSGKLLGTLTELVLEVSAGPDWIIEGVIGKVEFTELHPGEVFTALFKLRYRAATLQEHSLSHSSTQSSEGLRNARDVLNELDKMLGATDAKVLTARLTYKHSLLPTSTTCSVMTECHIKRCLPDPGPLPSPSRTNSRQARDCTVLVQKRLAYHLATHGSPRNAFKALHMEFGDRFQFSNCPEYINLLARELKYQARILERLEIEASPQKSPPFYAAYSPRENLGQGLIGAENCKPPYPATSEIPTEELFKEKPALAVFSVKESREQLRTDEARKIWGDLRKMKKSPHQTARGRSISSQLDDARHKDVREQAVRNKRSVGSETLRSLFSVGEGLGKGFGAPWM